MAARDLMGEHKRTGQFIFEDLTEKNVFLSTNLLNMTVHATCLPWFSINSLNIRQTANWYSKFNVYYNYCEESCAENVRLGGLTKNVCFSPTY